MVSIVVPVYRANQRVSRYLIDLVAFFRGKGVNVELICVQDGSYREDDLTWQLLEQMANQLTCRVTCVRLAENVGQQNASLCGIRRATGRLVITVDDDGKYQPAIVWRLYQRFLACQSRASKEREDKICPQVMYAEVKRQSRGRRTEDCFRAAGALMKEAFFTTFLGKPFGRKLTSCRIMSPLVVEYICQDRRRRVYLSARLLQVTQEIETIQFKTCHPAKKKEENLFRYNYHRLISLARNIIGYTLPEKWVLRSWNKLKTDCQYRVVAIKRKGYCVK